MAGRGAGRPGGREPRQRDAQATCHEKRLGSRVRDMWTGRLGVRLAKETGRQHVTRRSWEASTVSCRLASGREARQRDRQTTCHPKGLGSRVRDMSTGVWA